MKPLVFSAVIELIGINPFVYLPDDILQAVFKAAGKSKGPIAVHGAVNGKAYKQTLVRYAGAWRLYINLKMLEQSTKRIGERIDISIAFDPDERTIEMHPKLFEALREHHEAMRVFESLSPSLQNEIVRYISFLKTEKSVTSNIQKAIDFLLGKGRFIGRDGITINHKSK